MVFTFEVGLPSPLSEETWHEVQVVLADALGVGTDLLADVTQGSRRAWFLVDSSVIPLGEARACHAGVLKALQPVCDRHQITAWVYVATLGTLWVRPHPGIYHEEEA